MPKTPLVVRPPVAQLKWQLSDEQRDSTSDRHCHVNCHPGMNLISIRSSTQVQMEQKCSAFQEASSHETSTSTQNKDLDIQDFLSFSNAVVVDFCVHRGSSGVHCLGHPMFIEFRLAEVSTPARGTVKLHGNFYRSYL